MPIPTESPLVLSLTSDVDVAADVITYGFAEEGRTVPAFSEESEDQLSLTWTEPQKDFVRDAFAYLTTLLDVTFEEVDADVSLIDYVQVPTLEGSVTGYETPTAAGEADVVIPTDYIGLVDVTIIHETAHALGLSHPFDGAANLPGVTTDADLGTFDLNTELATRMSYNPGAWIDAPGMDIIGEEPTLGAIDIAVLQLIHGANTQTGLGDTTYGDDTSRVTTIWDNGGTDTIDYSTATDFAVIDLRAATLELEAGGGGFFTYIGREGGDLALGGYTIAYGVEIENAIGGSADDALTGNTLNNSLSGNDGMDWLFGGEGDDDIDGGDGIDTAAFSGLQSSYSVTLFASGTAVQDRRGDGDGMDTLADIEMLEFDSGDPFNLAQVGGAAGLSEADMETIIDLYIAYFDRAPDAIGLNYWATSFNNGTGFEEMASLFLDQDETRDRYPSTLTNQEFATTIYDDVLGRVPDQAGFDFWVGVLDSGAVSRDQFLLEVLRGAEASPPEGATQDFITQQTADRQFLENKTDIGAYFAVTKGMSDAANAAEVMALFDGSQSSLDAAVAATDSFYDEALDANSGEFLLTLVGVLDDPFAMV